MGMLVDGIWKDVWYDTEKTGGRFERSVAQFRSEITPNEAESQRYHLYVSLACPWAHRTLIMRALKGLEAHIGVSVVHWRMLEQGWTFEEGQGVIRDPEADVDFLHQIYTRVDPGYTGRVTVPVLFDRKHGTIVSNESADIIRLLNSAFDALPGVIPTDYYPNELRSEIDAINQRVYEPVNNGVYKSGFATAQGAYEEAVTTLFGVLTELDELLSRQRWLVGTTFTEADIRLFTTLVRFDAVYYSHFKCNLARLQDFEHLWAYTREIAQLDGVRGTIDMEHIKRHYYESQRAVNPTGIFPLGPWIDFDAPHGRERLGGQSMAD